MDTSESTAAWRTPMAHRGGRSKSPTAGYVKLSWVNDHLPISWFRWLGGTDHFLSWPLGFHQNHHNFPWNVSELTELSLRTRFQLWVSPTLSMECPLGLLKTDAHQDHQARVRLQSAGCHTLRGPGRHGWLFGMELPLGKSKHPRIDLLRLGTYGFLGVAAT